MTSGFATEPDRSFKPQITEKRQLGFQNLYGLRALWIGALLVSVPKKPIRAEMIRSETECYSTLAVRRGAEVYHRARMSR